MCPQCGGGLQGHYALSREPHGEDTSEHWLECLQCGSKVDPSEVQPECEHLTCTLKGLYSCPYCGESMCAFHFNTVRQACIRCFGDKLERGEL